MDEKNELLTLTSQIVSAHVKNNQVNTDELPVLIQDIYKTLTGLSSRGDARTGVEPAVPIDESIQPDFLVCLEDGKKLKMLKRHLKSHYDLSPEKYRERWGLPATYPMVAPNYAIRRRELAKEIGLGRHKS